jgi:hypothetical protein
MTLLSFSVSTVWSRVISFATWALYTQEKSLQYPFNWKLDRPRVSLDALEKLKFFDPLP